MNSIVFVNPPVKMQERYGWLSFVGSVMPSLGLCWLAAVARATGWKTTIIDAPFMEMACADTLRQILASRPDCVGLTSTTLSINTTAYLAAELKKQCPTVTLLLGGPHLSALPEETMRSLPEIDLGIIGEGEETLKELLLHQFRSDHLPAIKGLIYRDGGSLRLTGPRPLIVDLDSLPIPAWDLLSGFPNRCRPVFSRLKKLPAASLVTTRGCPNQCAFCDRSVLGRYCRSFSPAYSIKMIKELYHRYGVREILFEDDTVFVFKNRLQAICEGLLNEGLNLSWSCLGRVDKIDKELLKLMKRAGCWQIAFGIESGSQRLLNLMKKNITVEQVKTAVRQAKTAGLRVKGFFMLGFPGETESSAQETIRLARELKLDDLTITSFTPLPGSEIYNRAADYGSFDKDFQRMNLLETVFVPKDLSKARLAAFARRLMFQFYLRPSIIALNLSRLLALAFGRRP